MINSNLNDSLISTTRNFIINAEEELRNLIDKIMSGTHGVMWEQTSVGFSSERKEHLEKIKDDEKTKNKLTYENLIYYCYITDLKEIVIKNWEGFKSIFKDKRKTEILLNYLINYRNPCMHGRGLKVHKYHLCIGVCGELLTIISEWKEGYKEKIKGFECIFMFINKDKKNHPIKIDKELNDWIQRISNKIEFKTTNLEDYVEYKFENKQEFLRIKINRKIRPYSYQEKDRSLSNSWGKIVKLHTNSKKLFQIVIDYGRHPYWYLRINLTHRLDLRLIKKIWKIWV